MRHGNTGLEIAGPEMINQKKREEGQRLNRPRAETRANTATNATNTNVR